MGKHQPICFSGQSKYFCHPIAPVVLKVKNLHIQFEGPQPFHALQGVSFKIESGKTLALVGTSGSGKSLTSLAIMGLLPSNAKQTGYILLEEQKGVELILNTLSDRQWADVRGNKVSMVFQEPMSALNPIMSIGDQLAECLLTHNNVDKSAARQKAISWLEKVKLPQPKEIYERYPHQLSGGQKQRVMIAMAMCNNPAVLIADEPTTALDVTVQREIIALMKQLQEEYGTALLFITHDLALARLIADEFIILEKGKVVNHLYTPEFQVPDSQNVDNPCLLKVANLKVYYPEQPNMWRKTKSYFKAVDDVSFEIKKGDRMGLVGESGCGKSTLSKCILGLQSATEGNIWYKNTDLTNLSKKEWLKWRKSIQIIFQDPYAALNPRASIRSLLSEPLLVHNSVDKGQIAERLSLLLEQVQLPHSALDKYPHEFSGGQRQRICIARALAVEPEFIICDESVAALDVKIQAQVLELLYDLQEALGLTYLFITHDLKVVANFCNKVLVMEKGKIVEKGATADILHNPQQEYTKRLLAAVPQ
jgi:peptide/nickel transport system ATP-binding protein